ARAALHEVVEATHDGEDTEREDPDTDNTDDVDAVVVATEPTEDSEQSGNDVDHQDGTGQLPRGDGGPEGAVGTGDEDEPVLGERDLEEDNLVDVTTVLGDTAVLATDVQGGQTDPGADSKDEAEQDGHTPELGQ